MFSLHSSGGLFQRLHFEENKSFNSPRLREHQAFQAVKNISANAGDMGSIPGSGRSPGEGNSKPPQYSCLGNPMDRGAWQATVHRVIESWTRLSDFYTHTCTHMRGVDSAFLYHHLLSFHSSPQFYLIIKNIKSLVNVLIFLTGKYFLLLNK